MSTQSHCELLEQLFRAYDLEASVALELAAPPAAGFLLWPYAVESDPTWRNEELPTRSPTGGRAPRSAPRQKTRVLVLSPDLRGYDHARRLLLDSPVLGTGELEARVTIHDLPVVEMAALFSSSGLPFRLALALVIEGANAAANGR